MCFTLDICTLLLYTLDILAIYWTQVSNVNVPYYVKRRFIRTMIVYSYLYLLPLFTVNGNKI